ncbi:MAG: VWA domain-containing protein [Planctomycetes bacterium]|nr:VWA domain-containing protein [Planctomycetota bacterium]
MRPHSIHWSGIAAGLLCAIVLSALPLRSQQSGATATEAGNAAAETVDPAAALAARAAQAIADFEAVRHRKDQKRQADKLLLWLGEIDHESITRYLEERLEETTPKNEAIAFLRAIARVARPDLQHEVWTLLHDADASGAVKQAAAAALLTMGGRASDRVVSMLRKGSDAAKDDVRLAALNAVIATGDAALIQALAPVFEQGTSKDKVTLLRLFEPVREVAAISDARARLVRNGSLILSAIAWRQLAVESDPRAADLAIDLLERMPDGPTVDVAAEMIAGISLVRDPELYPLLLRYGAMAADAKNGAIKRALRAAAPLAAKDMELMRYMAKTGLEHSDRGAREAAMLLLREAPAEAVAPLVQRIRKKLRKPRKEALDLAAGLHDILAKDPTWKKDLLALARSSDAEVRAVGLTLLRELGSDEAIEIAQKSLGAREWELRTAAVRYLTNFRTVASIPLLIARVDQEDGRLAAELGTALFVHTGTRWWKEQDWKDWWIKHKSGFVLPHEETVRGAMAGTGGQTSAYFGIPLVSKKVAFLIDLSGSMNARIKSVAGGGTLAPEEREKGRRRIDAAKDELTAALAKIPSNFAVNVIPYSNGAKPHWNELREVDDENRKEILDFVRKLRVNGGTNIYGALEAAFADPSVDTIYLLTDGEPSVGDIVVPDEIADEVRRWNRLRQIVVHTIGIGIDSDLLKRLAEESGGVYKFVP